MDGLLPRWRKANPGPLRRARRRLARRAGLAPGPASLDEGGAGEAPQRDGPAPNAEAVHGREFLRGEEPARECVCALPRGLRPAPAEPPGGKEVVARPAVGLPAAR